VQQFIRKQKKKLITAILICMVAVLAFSFAFVVVNAEHECSGADCHVCEQILVCEAVISGLGLALATFASRFRAPRRFTQPAAFCLPALSFSCDSLLLQKVRLNM
jgi:hypothetical protein